jgi:hypothetical protein
MPMRRFSVAAPGLLLIGLAACVPRPAAPPPEPPPPPPPPAPSPPPPAAEPPGDWRDVPLSAGDWALQGRTASFGEPGAAVFAMRCDGGRISLARLGAQSGRTIAVRTTYGERVLPANGEGAALVASLAVNDALLDEIAFSRGRFMVRTEGAAPLFLPAWPEAARVIEDCRGA